MTLNFAKLGLYDKCFFYSLFIEFCKSHRFFVSIFFCMAKENHFIILTKNLIRMISSVEEKKGFWGAF